MKNRFVMSFCRSYSFVRKKIIIFVKRLFFKNFKNNFLKEKANKRVGKKNFLWWKLFKIDSVCHQNQDFGEGEFDWRVLEEARPIEKWFKMSKTTFFKAGNVNNLFG